MNTSGKRQAMRVWLSVVVTSFLLLVIAGSGNGLSASPPRPENWMTGGTMSSVSAPQVSFQSTIIMDNDRFVYEPDFYEPQIRDILVKYSSPLLEYQDQIEGESLSASHIILRACLGKAKSINPKVLLTILEMRGHLLTDVNASVERDFLGIPSLQDFSARVRWIGDTLWTAYVDFPTGNRKIILLNRDGSITG